MDLDRPNTYPGPPDSPILIEDFSLEDLEAVRLLLRGGSVVDWHHLDFQNHADVDRFLRVNEIDPTSEADIARLEELRHEAVDYLSDNFDFEIPDKVAIDIPARDLFLVASKRGPHQVWACVILKVIHIIHHLAGRELFTSLPISFDQMHRAIELKVMRVVEELKAAGYPIAEFEWSRKTSHSLVTKLLAKRSTLAANIYDRLRFRMIVKKQSDIAPMLVALHRQLIPFNYVVPGESVNHLVSFSNMLAKHKSLKALGSGLQSDKQLERTLEKASAAPINEFSSPSYKIINFVADLPIRVDSFLKDLAPNQYGNVVFVLTEFQIADKQTATDNQSGDNSHDKYKARQFQSVSRRLMRGRRQRRNTLNNVPPSKN